MGSFTAAELPPEKGGEEQLMREAELPKPQQRRVTMSFTDGLTRSQTSDRFGG